VNLVTRITKNYVKIVKKKGMSIAITPADNESFVEKANLALSQWVKTSVQQSLVEKPLNNAKDSWSAKSAGLGYLFAE
jgi:hypothetical protein